MGSILSVEPKSEMPPHTSKQTELLHNFDIEIKEEKTGDDILSELGLNICRRNSHHSRYISISSLGMDTLPENLRTENMLKFVKCALDTVVRICVSSTSESRQEDLRYRLTPQLLGSSKRYGSGWLCLPLEQDEVSIRIVTARHLVYDKSEAENTEVTFFYDGPNESQAAVAKGKSVLVENNERDFVVLECDTVDEDLRQKLSDVLLRLRNMRLSCDSVLNRTDDEKEEATALIISHPHGGSKHLTFGSCVDFEEFDAEFDMETGGKRMSKCVYKYNTTTCPGSSGAPVIIFGKPGVSYYWTPHCHANESGYGKSAKGLVIWGSSDNNEQKII